MKWYILVRSDRTAELQRLAEKPTESSHGYDEFRYAYGPFNTKADAEKAARFDNLKLGKDKPVFSLIQGEIEPGWEYRDYVYYLPDSPEGYGAKVMISLTLDREHKPKSASVSLVPDNKNGAQYGEFDGNVDLDWAKSMVGWKQDVEKKDEELTARERVEIIQKTIKWLDDLEEKMGELGGDLEFVDAMPDDFEGRFSLMELMDSLGG